MDRQYNDWQKKDKRTNNDLQNTKQKTNDRASQASIKAGVNTVTSEGVTVPAPRVTPVVLLMMHRL
jgi:hypothetical protein